MKPLFCSKGHDNLPGSRFCQSCGEPLQQSPAGAIGAGTIVGDRYRLIRELGHGGFGRTYLAEDINRFNERCVLKEFAPKVQGTYAQQKAEELFAREAGVLYQLQHPQIPKFRELCRSPVAGKSRLFLVQDYVDGETYRALLLQRRQQGKRFSEAQVTQLLVDLLPVLDYIHTRGVIHRDISPDNLILRNFDQLPVLIDFGGVKQVAADVELQVMAPPVSGSPVPVATRLGKVGYAPDEQMMLGQVYPHSDLYALAVTVLVLLTGQEPHQLFDPQTLSWVANPESKVSPALEQVLHRMMARRDSDRYHSAREVLEALTRLESAGGVLSVSAPPVTLPPQNLPVSATVFPTQLPPEIDPPPLAISSPAAPAYVTQTAAIDPNAPFPTSTQNHSSGRSRSLRNVLFVILLVMGAGSAGWWGGKYWVKSHPSKQVLPREEPDLFEAVDPDLAQFSSRYSPEELKRKSALRDRRKQLSIDYHFYVNLVNETFYERYPTQRGRVLTYEPADEPWRDRWDAIAEEILDYLATLSEDARRGLGRYDLQQRDRWKSAVNRLKLSSRALYDLADAKFFHRFPEQKGMDFIHHPIGQIWQAIVVDELTSLQNGNTLESIHFYQGAFRHEVDGSLAPGAGRAYIASLSKGQILRLSLQANGSTLLSIYQPDGSMPPLLEDSREQSWSGILPESGHYEIIVVSDSGSPIFYQLNLAADNVTSE